MNGNRILDAKIPGGPLADKWDRHMMDNPLVAPGGNRRKFKIIVVGTGLAGASVSATCTSSPSHHAAAPRRQSFRTRWTHRPRRRAAGNCRNWRRR